MAEEIKGTTEPKPQEEKSVPVTDDALASAWESDQKQTDAKVEVKKEEPKVEPKVEQKAEPEKKEEVKEEIQEPEEPVDNAERSRLGRRLKQIEEQNKQLINEIQSLRGGQPKQEPQENVTFDRNYVNQRLQSILEAAVERGEIPATVVTPQDSYLVDRFVKTAEAQIVNEANQKFASGYIQTLQSPHLKGDTPDDIHAEVIAELYKEESPFNLKRLYNPVADAHLNYMEAKNAILQKRLTENKPKTVFKGKPENAPPIGTSVSTRTETVSNDLPELDAASQDLIKRMGMSPESVKAALSKEMPYYLRGSR